MGIPRVLYTYWEGPINDVVSLCINSMREQNPDWKVVVANRSTCEAVCGRQCPPNMTTWRHQMVADWFRLQCLAAHGGVWLDASCLCLKPLEAWVDIDDAVSLQAYEAPLKKRGILESWALACAPGCLFVEAWADEIHNCACIGRANYRKMLPSYAFPGKGAVKYEQPYYTIHQAALKVLHEHADFPVKMLSSRLDGGPYDSSTKIILDCIVDLKEGRLHNLKHAFFKINGDLRRKILKLQPISHA